MPFSWFRSWTQRQIQPARRGARTPRRPSCRPRLETLEMRLAPATRVWDGGGTTNNWSDPINWVGNVAPVVGDDLRFAASGVDSTSLNNTNDFGTPTSPVFFRSITIDGTGYTLGGNGIVLGDGGITSAASVTNTINLPLSLNPSLIPVDVGAGATLTLNGILSGGASGGLGIFFDKLGAGELVLTGANTYESLTRVLAGTLNVRSTSALGSSNGFGDSTTVFGGATLELQGGVSVGPESLTLGSSGGGATVRNAGGNNTWTGTIDMSRAATFDIASGSELTVSGILGGTSGSTLTKTGSGRLLLSGANTYSGQTLINQGALNVRSATALGSTLNGTVVSPTGILELESTTGITIAGEALTIEGESVVTGELRNRNGNNVWTGTINLGAVTDIQVDGTSQLTLSGVISGDADEDLDKRGTGTLILTTANTYQGLTIVFAGTLVMRNASALGSNTNGTFVQPGATLTIDGPFSQVSGEALTLSGTLAKLSELRLSTTTWTGNVTLNGASTIRTDADATVVLSGTISGSQPMTKEGVGVLSIAGATSNTNTGLVTVNQGRLELAKTGGAQAMEGNLVINGGEVRYIQGGQLPDDTIVTVNSAGLLNLNGKTDTIDELHVNGGNVRILGASGTNSILAVNDRVTSTNSAGTPSLIEVSNGFLTLTGTSTRTITVNDGPADVDLAFTGNFGGSALTKNGTGRLEIRTPFGEPGMQINAGVVRFVNLGGSLGNIGGVSVASGAALELSGGLTLPGSFGPILSGTGINGTGALRILDGNHAVGGISLTGNATIAVDAGQLSATSIGTASTVTTATNLTKKGPGTLIVGSTAFRTGSNATVEEGTLLINGTASTATGFSAIPVTINTGATLGGSGTVGTISSSGIVSPGTAAGILTANGNLVLSAVSTLHIDLNGTTPGSGHDQVNVPTATDLVVLNNANLSVNLGFASAVGNTYTIIANGGTEAINGVFAQGNTISVAGPNGNVQFSILYNVGNNDVVLRHDNTGSAFRDRTVTPSVTEGNFATLTGKIVEPDPLDYFILTVNWGDGSPVETFVFEPGSDPDVQLRHRYLDNRPGELASRYTIQLSWRDQHGGGNSGTLDVVVLNANPIVLAGGDDTVRNGQQFVRHGSFTDPGRADTWTATVDYGDGTPVQTLELRRDGTFRLQHRYTQPGVYQVTIRVFDDDGGIGLATFLITVE